MNLIGPNWFKDSVRHRHRQPDELTKKHAVFSKKVKDLLLQMGVEKYLERKMDEALKKASKDTGDSAKLSDQCVTPTDFVKWCFEPYEVDLSYVYDVFKFAPTFSPRSHHDAFHKPMIGKFGFINPPFSNSKAACYL